MIRHWWKKSAALLLALALLAGGAPAAFAETASQVNEVRSLLETYHLDAPDSELLNRAAIEGMIQAIGDPYTQYMSPEEWEAFANNLEQQYVGIGVYLTVQGETVYVQDVIPDAPAEKAGVQPGDAIVQVDGKRPKSLQEAQQLLYGEAGTPMNLMLSRDGKQVKVRIVRQTFVVPSASARMMGERIGYLALTSFSTDAPHQFARHLEELEKNGLNALILDLRGNGGGYIDASRQIAAHFIKEGVLAHLIDRNGNDEPLVVSGKPRPYPVYVLVNEGTASASELLAGALQDYGVARLVGKPTYGKGVAQLLLPVSGGGMLKVTAQEYLTPKKRKVDGVGLKPDQIVEGNAAQLIVAYRTAGGRKLSVTVGKGTVQVNGVRAAQPDAAYKHNGTWYVNGRLAAALIGARLEYDRQAKAVVLIRNGGKKTFRNAGDGLHVKNGVSAFDVRQLAKWTPGLSWNERDHSLTIRVHAAE
jgi:carboxyl-terminal processing protease